MSSIVHKPTPLATPGDAASTPSSALVQFKTSIGAYLGQMAGIYLSVLLENFEVTSVNGNSIALTPSRLKREQRACLHFELSGAECPLQTLEVRFTAARRDQLVEFLEDFQGACMRAGRTHLVRYEIEGTGSRELGVVVPGVFASPGALATAEMPRVAGTRSRDPSNSQDEVVPFIFRATVVCGA